MHKRASFKICYGFCAEDAELDAYKAHLDGAKNVPEQLFGDSFLRLSHEASGVCLEFTALDALHTWRKDDRPPVRVGAAQDWLKARQKDVEASGAVSFEYDWCADHNTLLLLCMLQSLGMLSQLTSDHADFWCCRTYTTSYKGTLRTDSNGDASVSGENSGLCIVSICKYAFLLVYV